MFENIPDFLGAIGTLSLADVFHLITSNLLTLVWILLVPFLLYKNDQGKELLIGLFDDAEAFTGVRASALIFLFHVLALAIFYVPVVLFPGATDEELAKLRPVTGQHAYIALFACALPMLFYSAIVFIQQYNRQRKWWLLAVFPGLIVLGSVLAYLMLHGPRYSLALISLLTGGNMALCFGLILLIRWIKRRQAAADKKDVNIFLNYMAVGFCLALQLPLIAGALRNLDWLFLHNLPMYNLNYLMTIGIAIVTVVFLSFAHNLQSLSPTFVLMGIIIFYLMVGDAVIAAYVIWPNWAKYLLSAVLAFVAYVMFIRKAKMHTIHRVPTQITTEQRTTLETFFDRWWDINIAPTLRTNTSGEIPIYLFGIQGGGSRAGFWACELLNRLDEETNGQFHKHIFAAASASGGSSGFGAMLALWRYLDEHPTIPDARKIAIRRQFARGMFGKNYLSSAFFQLLLAEAGKRFLELFGKKVHNRNFVHQSDESLAFAHAIREGWESGTTNGDDNKSFFTLARERFRSLFDRGYRDPIDAGDAGKIPNYPMRPYLSYWYHPDGRVDGRLPLYFPITFNIQTGKSGFTSAVEWNPKVFIDAIDILKSAESDQAGAREKQSVPLVGASHLSQLFPVMNAYTFVPGAGNFIDGGMFENQGLTIVSQLQGWLQQYIATRFSNDPGLRDRIRIRVVFIVNAAIEPKQAEPVKPLSQLTAITRAVGFAGIGGRSTWWNQYFYQRLPDNLQPTEIILQYPDDPKDETQQVPLGRWLSNRSMARMQERLEATDVKVQWEKLVQEVS